MTAVGDAVENFSLPDQTGVTRTLSELARGGAVVLFFYPAALSTGCTAESCHFRDLTSAFRAVGAQPVGISPDAVDVQAKFAGKHTFGYPLLADVDGAVARRFGVRRPFGPLRTKRWTFVIDPRLTVVGIVKTEIAMHRHADRALQIVERLHGERPAS